MQLILAQKSSPEGMECSVSNSLISPALQPQWSFHLNHNFSCLPIRLRNLCLPSDQRSPWESKSTKYPFFIVQLIKRKIPLIPLFFNVEDSDEVGFALCYLK